MRCLEGILYEQTESNLAIENSEFRTVTISLIDAITLNVSTGKAMKVGNKGI